MRLELLVERGGRANYTSPTKRTIGGVRSRCCKRCGSKRFQLPDTSQEPACRMMWISLAPYFLASTGATPGTSRCWASLVGFAATRASSVRLLNILNTGTPRRCASPLPHARRPVASASSTPLHDGTLSQAHQRAALASVRTVPLATVGRLVHRRSQTGTLRLRLGSLLDGLSLQNLDRLALDQAPGELRLLARLALILLRL